jgi:ribosomal protein L40E
MHLNDLIELGVVDGDPSEIPEEPNNNNGSPAKKKRALRDPLVDPMPEKEPWKKRSEILSGLYKSVNKESKVCKKCGTSNPFFMFECRKCQFRIGKTRSDRSTSTSNFMSSSRGDQGILGANTQMSVDNYSVVFWEFL